MNNPLNRKYTSIRKAKKAFKKSVGEDFPRWYLYKKWFERMYYPPFTLPSKWEWLRKTQMHFDFDTSFARHVLFWDDTLIEEFHAKGFTLC